MLSAFSAYDLPNMEALVHYLHAAAGFPVKSTYLATIKAVNYATCPGLTFSYASKYFPESRETIKCHMVQTCQVVRYTKPILPIPTPPKQGQLKPRTPPPLNPVQRDPHL